MKSKMKRIYYLLIFICLMFGCNTAPERQNKPPEQNSNKLPEADAYVEDYEGVLVYDSGSENWTYNHLATLDSTLQEFEYRTGNEIAIITVADISPYSTLKDYATAIANQWGVGKKEKNNGLVIAVSTKRREIWIATGKGTEKIITNEICKNIIDTKMLPEFSKGKIFEGIEIGLHAIMDTWCNAIQINTDTIR